MSDDVDIVREWLPDGDADGTEYPEGYEALNRLAARLEATEAALRAARTLIEGAESDAEGELVVRRGDGLALAAALAALDKETQG